MGKLKCTNLKSKTADKQLTVICETESGDLEHCVPDCHNRVHDVQYFVRS